MKEKEHTERNLIGKSRSFNSTRNAISGIIVSSISLLSPFVTRTIILYQLGADYLGLGSLFSSILQVLNMTEFGFSQAIAYSMYEPIAKKDKDTICALLAFYRKVYTIIGILFFGLGLILMPFLKWFIKGAYPSEINIYLLYGLYLVNTGISYLAFAYKGVIFVSHQRVSVVNNINSITQILQCTLQIVMLILFKNYYLFYAAVIVSTVICNLLTAACSQKYYPQYICSGSLSPETKNEIKKNIKGLVIQKISMVSRNSFDNIFISAFLGLTMAAIYGNYFYIMSAVHVLMSELIKAVMASVGDSLVTEDIKKNYEDFCKINFIYIWISGWFVTCLLCLYQHFMTLWAGRQYLLGFSTMVLFCIYFYSNCVGDTFSLYMQAGGLWDKVKIVYVSNSILNIILNFFLGWQFGVFGIVLATDLTGVFGWCLLCHKIHQNLFKEQKESKIYYAIIKYSIIVFVTAAICYGICSLLPENGIWFFLLKMAICIVLPNCIFVLAYCRTAIFKKSKSDVISVFYNFIKK